MKSLVKAIIEGTGLYGPVRWLHRHKALILMYHGLTTDSNCEEWNQVHLDEFERQMEYVRRHYHVVSLGDLVLGLRDGGAEPLSAAVTFDDGYKSVYDLAYPVLRRHGIPASVFVTTEFVSDGGEPRYTWTDRISLLLQSGRGGRVDLTSFGLGTWDLATRSQVYRARCAIAVRLKHAPSRLTDEVLGHLQERFGDAVDHEANAVYHPLTWDEVRALAADATITIGGHTRTHPILSRVDGERLHAEILGCKRDLESRLGIEVTEFAYPNGKREDIGDDALHLVRSSFRCAVTTEEGLNARGDDPFLLRRMSIGSDLRLERFKAVLSGAYHL